MGIVHQASLLLDVVPVSFSSLAVRLLPSLPRFPGCWESRIAKIQAASASVTYGACACHAYWQVAASAPRSKYLCASDETFRLIGRHNRQGTPRAASARSGAIRPCGDHWDTPILLGL